MAHISKTTASILGEGRREDLGLPPKKKNAEGEETHQNKYKNPRDARRAALDLPARKRDKDGKPTHTNKKVSEATAAILGESSVAELERKLRRLRQEIFNYEGTPEEDEKMNELLAVKAQLMALRQSVGGDEDRGPHSGLTRGELSRSRTSETD